uniref:uncharacterized protein LOC113475146 n=1 Tax=Ciona intestinalis TaxID=7719 RepID=UPI000EF4583E
MTGDCWCSTQQEFSDDGKWGFCPCAKPRPGVRLLAEYGTSPGDPCHFPFTYKGRTYDSCITEHRGSCWCGTTSDVDVDQKWGFCPCDGPSYSGTWGVWGAWSTMRPGNAYHRCQCGEIRFRKRACDPPTELKFFVTGREVVCEGKSVDAEICSCLHERLTAGKYKHVLDVRDRTKIIDNVKKQNYTELRITKLQVEDSGIWICNIAALNRHVQMHRLAVYHLNVVDVLHMKTIYLDADEQPHDNGRYGIDWITWHWTAWQECDRCDVAGERRRY